MKYLVWSRLTRSLVMGLILMPISLLGQDFEFKIVPPTLEIKVGDTATVNIQVVDQAGSQQDVPFLLFSRGRGAVQVTPNTSGQSGNLTAKVIARRPGSFSIIARTMGSREERIQARVAIEIPYPPLEKITFTEKHDQVYAGTQVTFVPEVIDAAGLSRPEATVAFTTSDAKIASVNRFGQLTAHKTGAVRLIATVENIQETLQIKVTPNPVTHMEITGDKTEARTGDVIRINANAKDRRNRVVADAPIHFSFVAEPLDNLAPPASGQILDDGRFVAETPGLYTITAKSGGHTATHVVEITPRDVQQSIRVVGHGPVVEVFTSDLWVWEGVDGRDYAVTGTWGSNGEAYFWDVTDPANPVIIDTVTVDARTVNDVKVSEDGRVAVISREGASNRRNGLVILDVTNPRDVKIQSRFDDELTGGVHNVFIYKDHVYAVNNGRRYDIINIEDPANPYRVSRFELSSPGHSIHDVWIEDGIAYSSNWRDGIQMVDVGAAATGGPFKRYEEVPMPEVKSPFFAGGSPSNPQQFASYAYPSGRNHAAFPFHSQSTNKFYVLAGDEIFPYGLGVRDKKPTIAGGYIHFIEFTNPQKPEEIARFEVPEAGSHNYWVEDDVLYAAFYNGGLRVVDISGELMGDLYRQGREIARFKPIHSEGLIPNAPMVWGPQPYKGNIFLADMNSGLWVVKLVPNSRRGR